MYHALLVGLGGFFGAMARYLLSATVGRTLGESFPYGTLCVNLLGSLAIGVLMGLALVQKDWSEELRLVLIVGLLGSLTTFSTFSWETLDFLRAGNWARAISNVGANVLLALLATGLGLASVRALLSSL